MNTLLIQAFKKLNVLSETEQKSMAERILLELGSNRRIKLSSSIMKRGDLYRVYKGNGTDTKDFRVFVVISRQVLIDSKFSTVICPPIYSTHDSISTQVFIRQSYFRVNHF